MKNHDVDILKLAELRKEIFSLKIAKKTSGMEKPHRLVSLRKEVARLLTNRNKRG